MPSALVLAVDVGSTWCKAAYIDRQGQIVATGRAYTRAIASARTTTLPAFWQAFVDAVRAATNALSTPIPPAAIGFSSRALFGVCLDQAGAWFMPAWDAQLDRRTSPELQHAYSPAIWGAQDPFAFGYGVSVGGMLYWLKRTRPAEWRTIRRVGALHDYLLYQLTDSWVTNPATGPGEAGWPAQIPLLADLPPAAFPPVWQPHELAGELTPAAAQLLALPAGIPVVVGAHDGAAANLGLGAIAPNDGCLTLGTNLVLRVVTGVRVESRSFGYVVAPGCWAWVGNVPGASWQLDAVAGALRPDLPNVAQAHRALAALAWALPPHAGDLVLPIHPPDADAALQVTLDHAQRAGHSAEAIYRATVEAVAAGVVQLVQRAAGDGAQAQRLIATGGHTQNTYLLQHLSTALDRPIAIGATEAGLIGAAMLAAIGAGWYASVTDAVHAMSMVGPAITPKP